MMAMKFKLSKPSTNDRSEMKNTNGARDLHWELRPNGMIVQRRDLDPDRASAIVPTIKIRVKYGSATHEIQIGSQATFGELKKMLSARTGLEPGEQRLMFKKKERDSKAYLDTSGVKDRSKMVLIEDPMTKERRFLEMKKRAKMERASKSIDDIRLQVDQLTAQVAALESVICKGEKVAESDVLNLIEMLMEQLIKLDCIVAEGEVKLQRGLQVRRVQKYVETLDSLQIQNSMLHINCQQTHPAPFTVTTDWETFE